jgi:hypothetical protein
MVGSDRKLSGCRSKFETRAGSDGLQAPSHSIGYSGYGVLEVKKYPSYYGFYKGGYFEYTITPSPEGPRSFLCIELFKYGYQRTKKNSDGKKRMRRCQTI